MKMTPFRTSLIVSAAVSAARLGINLVVTLLSFRWPETQMVLLLDLPTMAIYGIAEKLGFSWPIPSSCDWRFLVISSGVWFALAFLLSGAVALTVLRFRKVRS